ncbi:hypothetical protein MPH_07497 [Macrophomina phaseolina MS6]|uniref:Uncharacterized protein n=1 Tax=Macrophomina phaseolina (strain MS6) TaxID=1126212 RepID=K2RKT0_MACPH|nr:hypothetical protein MPH_07497 [Macrophomina phaseolina MS6]
MASNVVTSNGWDLIAAATQDALNAQLAKLPLVDINMKTTQTIVSGLDAVIDLQISLAAPQLRIRPGSGHQVDVLLPLSGNITINDQPLLIGTGQQVIVTTELSEIEAQVTVAPNGANQTTYQLVIDFESPDAIVDVSTAVDPLVYGLLVLALKKAIKDTIGKNPQYQVASYTITNNQASQYQALIPYVADFTFVQDSGNAEHSNFLLLMQTVTPIKGSLAFDSPVLAPDQDFAVVVSNKLFIQYYVLPAIISKIKGMAKNGDAVPGQINVHSIAGQQYMYEIANTGNIALNKDHDPWISQITASIDTEMQALCLYLDGQADVTSFNIHVDAWDRSWLQFSIDNSGNISLVQVKEEKNSSTSLEWWQWLIEILAGPIPLMITAITYAIVSTDEPDLGGSFATLGQNVVTWPNQNTLIPKKITTPNHVVFTLDVDFST